MFIKLVQKFICVLFRKFVVKFTFKLCVKILIIFLTFKPLTTWTELLYTWEQEWPSCVKISRIFVGS